MGAAAATAVALNSFQIALGADTRPVHCRHPELVSGFPVPRANWLVEQAVRWILNQVQDDAGGRGSAGATLAPRARSEKARVGTPAALYADIMAIGEVE